VAAGEEAAADGVIKGRLEIVEAAAVAIMVAAAAVDIKAAAAVDIKAAAVVAIKVAAAAMVDIKVAAEVTKAEAEVKLELMFLSDFLKTKIS
jgi:hypothetical protein